MSEITYTTNYNLAKPWKGMIDWDDEANGNFDTIDSEMGRNRSDLKQIANDVYQVPEAIDLTVDTDGGNTVSVGAGNTGDYNAGDKARIWDDNTSAQTFTVASKDNTAGTITMTGNVPSGFTTSQGAKIQRIDARLNNNGNAVLSERIEDQALFTQICRFSITGVDKVVTISKSKYTKSNGVEVSPFLRGKAGEEADYAGGTVDFGTGIVTGGGVNFTPPSIGSDYITAIISLSPFNVLVVKFGTQASTYSDARNETNRATDQDVMGLYRVTLRGDGAGSFKTIRHEDIEDMRPFLGLVGGDTESTILESYVLVHSTKGIYTDLWTAVANITANQTIFVGEDQTTSIARDLTKAFPYKIEFLPGLKVICDTAIAGSVIKFGDDIVTKNFKLECTHDSGTTTSGFEFNGDRNYHENIQFNLNCEVVPSFLGDVTNAYLINSGKKANYINGIARQQYGSVTNAIMDNSGNATNDASIRAQLS